MPEVPPPLPQTLRRRWVQFIKQPYEVDPLLCPRCAGEMRIIAFIDQQEVIEKILRHLVPWLPRAHDPPEATEGA